MTNSYLLHMSCKLDVRNKKHQLLVLTWYVKRFIFYSYILLLIYTYLWLLQTWNASVFHYMRFILHDFSFCPEAIAQKFYERCTKCRPLHLSTRLFSGVALFVLAYVLSNLSCIWRMYKRNMYLEDRKKWGLLFTETLQVSSRNAL